MAGAGSSTGTPSTSTSHLRVMLLAGVGGRKSVVIRREQAERGLRASYTPAAAQQPPPHPISARGRPGTHLWNSSRCRQPAVLLYVTK
jgi:hypothetical protein